MSRDVEIEGFLRAEGFVAPEAIALARDVLEIAGLTRPGKRRISAAKLDAARELLARRLVGVCGQPECSTLARDAARETRTAVSVAPAACAVCGGSNNRRAAAALAGALRRAGLRRLLIVGGSPEQHRDLAAWLGPSGIELRCVDGAAATRSRRDARPDLEWAQLLVVWGATPLPHKVSRLYTDDPPPRLRTVALARRGTEALCRQVLRRLG